MIAYAWVFVVALLAFIALLALYALVYRALAAVIENAVLIERRRVTRYLREQSRLFGTRYATLIVEEMAEEISECYHHVGKP